MTIPVSVQLPEIVSEIYALPAEVASEDGSIYVRRVGEATGVLLGRGTDVRGTQPVTADGETAAVVRWYSNAAGTTTFAVPGGHLLALEGDASAVALEFRGRTYTVAGATVVGYSAVGVVDKFALAELDPQVTPPPLRKGMYLGGGPGLVTALVPAMNGDVLAVRATGLAAAVTDLRSGTSVNLEGYTAAGPAARLRDGTLSVLAWNSLDDTATVHLLLLDGTRFSVLTDIDLGLGAGDLLEERILPGLGFDLVVAISHGDTPTVELDLWTLDGTKLAKLAAPLNSGLEAAAASPSSVFLYNGPARNKVGLLDLVSGEFRDSVVGFETPEGSYVLGLLPGG